MVGGLFELSTWECGRGEWWGAGGLVSLIEVDGVSGSSDGGGGDNTSETGMIERSMW